MRVRKDPGFGRRDKRMKVNRKGQEEIVGFILIVVIVAVVAVILLGISIRKTGSSVESDSAEIYQFLGSMMQYTTDCAVVFEPDFSSLGELIEECYSNTAKTCTSGENVCDVLEENVKGILDSSWEIGEDRPNKGYEFSSVYVSGTQRSDIFEIIKGECEGSFRGSEFVSSAFPGKIENSFKLCF